MKKIIFYVLELCFICFSSLLLQAQTTLNTTAISGFANNNGSGTVTFNFQNTNSYPIKITDIEGISRTAGTMTAEIYYNLTPVNTTTAPPITAANGWILGATGTFTAVANSSTVVTQTFLSGISVVIPANVTYGMAITCYTGTSGQQGYFTMAATYLPLTTLSGGGCNILMGTNISWAGGAPPTAPINTPRGWLGKLTFIPAHNYANDAGVTAITSPTTPLSPGFSNVTVTIKNSGQDTLKTVGLRWSVDGNNQTPPSNWTTALAPGATSGNITLGSFNFANGSHTIKAWTTSPNNLVDSNANNDTSTSSVYVCAVIAGNFIVGAAPSDFTTLSAALTAISSCGINGPVNITMKPGTYSGRVVISPVPGASDTNTVTINGRYADSVKFTYLGTSSALATILFNGADYITFKNVTIENTGTTYSFGACLMNSANYNTFDSCKIIVDQTTTGTTTAGIISTSPETSASGYADNANYTTISNCTIKGGYYGIKFNGPSSTVRCTNNSVINSTFDKVYYHGINSYYQAYPTFENNYLAGFRSTSAYGIYNYYGGANPIFNNNTILGVSYGIYNYGYSTTPCSNPQINHNTIRASAYGLYQYYCTTSNIERNDFYAGYSAMYISYETNPVDSSVIANNFGHQGGGTYTYGNGLYLGYSAKVGVYHNTLQTDTTYSSAPSSYGTCYVRNASGPIKIKNNILKSYGNMPCFNNDGINIAAGDLDYNICYTVTSGNWLAYVGTVSYTSWSLIKSTFPTYNMNSQNVDPQLVSRFNLHLSAAAPFFRGTFVGIEKDFDNDSRCLPTPTIGADEYNHPYSKLTADFYIDSFVCFNSPFTFLNKAGVNDPFIHYWYLNGSFQTRSLNFTHTFTSSGIDTVSLISQNCSTRDTMTKIFTVQPTNSASVSTFISNKNLVEVYEEVSLIDLSSSCPQRWKWTISPDSIDDPLLGYRTSTYAFITGNDSSQFPKITFLYSGKYTICLTTSNSFGTGTPYCVNNYIEVKPTASLCIFPFDSKETYGNLYDEGGYLGQYLPNKTCGFFIHPCANSVSLVFRSFDIIGDATTGDFMRIFDGPDNKSKPLWNTVLYQRGINNSTFAPGLSDTFVGTSGMLYIELATDASTQANGFIASWTSVQENYITPDASFDVVDTVCNGVPTFFHNTSTGTQNDSYWDFDNDNFTDANTRDGVYTYLWDGDYTVKLTVSGCGGVDTFSKHIYVQTSYSTPQFEIVADNYKPNIFNELVTVTENTLKNCVDSTIWDITPKSYTLVSGKLQNSYTLGLKFNDTVCYDFKVIGIYHGMSDTMYYPCFIKPLYFCKPVASNLNPDIGISRVALNTINNYSDIGITEYTDYTNSIITDLEKGARYDITLERKTNFNPISRKVWIDYNQDGNFDEKTELAAYDTSSNSLSWTGLLSLSNNVDYITTRMRVGTSLAGSSNSPCGPNYFGEFEDYKVRFIPDKTKPIISLIGPSLLHVMECSSVFVDPGFIAYDNVDTHLSDSVQITGTVNTSLSGTYYIKYNLKDAAGNVADELIRTVIVDKETTPPVFTLKGPLTETIQVFNTWYDSGYVAYDTCSGLDFVQVTNNLDITKLGTYLVNYEAFDYSGNSVKASRTLYVVDTISPVIKSVSNDTIHIKVYHLLPNPLYTISDNYYSNIAITIKGTYYENFPNGEATNLGYYTFKYIATDGSGNSDSISFVIHVMDDTKPVLELNGFVYYQICRFDTLNDPGYTVKDNFDKKPAVIKSGNYITDYLVNRKVGMYDLIYTATDNSGNKAVETRSIFVTDQGDCYSSVNSVEITNGLRLYPNPGNGKFNIEFNIAKADFIGISVYDALGNIIYQNIENIQPRQVKVFDYYDMKPGMYLIQIVQGEKITSLKYNLMK